VLDLTERKRAEKPFEKRIRTPSNHRRGARPHLVSRADGEATYVSQRLWSTAVATLMIISSTMVGRYLYIPTTAAFTKEYYQTIQTGTPTEGVLRLR
jgi:hypothetical protein